MNRIQRGLAVLAGLSGALITLIIAAPAALANLPPPEPAPPVPVKVHTVVTGGMPGWQITLIAVGAALLAAALAVLLDRAWAGTAARNSTRHLNPRPHRAPGQAAQPRQRAGRDDLPVGGADAPQRIANTLASEWGARADAQDHSQWHAGS